MDEKERMDKAVCIAVLAVILLAAAFSWYYIAGRNDVHDIRERADDVRNQLTDAQSAQQAERAAIDSAQQSVDSGRQGIAESQRTVSRIQETERSDGDIIRESQSIIDQVRKRGPAQDTGKN